MQNSSSVEHVKNLYINLFLRDATAGHGILD